MADMPVTVFVRRLFWLHVMFGNQYSTRVSGGATSPADGVWMGMAVGLRFFSA